MTVHSLNLGQTTRAFPPPLIDCISKLRLTYLAMWKDLPLFKKTEIYLPGYHQDTKTNEHWCENLVEGELQDDYFSRGNAAHEDNEAWNFMPQLLKARASVQHSTREPKHPH